MQALLGGMSLFRGPIARSTFRTSMVLLLRLVVQASSLLLVARMLGVSLYGSFVGMAALAVLMGTLAHIGANLVLLGALSKDPEKRDSILVWAIPVILLTATVLLAIYGALVQILFHSLKLGWPVCFFLGLAELLLQPLYALVAAEVHARSHVARSQLILVIPLGLRVIFAGVILFYQPQEILEIYIYGYFLSVAGPLWWFLSRIDHPWPGVNQWRWPSVSELKNSASYAVLNMTHLGPSELDKMLASRLLPLGDAGLYAAAARSMAAFALPVVALLMSALPRLFREGLSSSESAKRLIRWIFAISFIYGFLAAFLLWIVSPFMEWLLGNSYIGASAVLRNLCLVVLGLSLRIAAGHVLIALDRSWIRLRVELAGLMILIVFALALTPRFGLSGMVLAWTSAEISMAFVGWFFIFNFLGKKQY